MCEPLFLPRFYWFIVYQYAKTFYFVLHIEINLIDTQSVTFYFMFYLNLGNFYLVNIVYFNVPLHHTKRKGLQDVATRCNTGKLCPNFKKPL